MDTPADDNAVDGKIGGTESAVTDRMEYQKTHYGCGRIHGACVIVINGSY